jgi:sugar lactone lactonase YvrE
MSTIIRVPYDGSNIKTSEQQLYFINNIKAAGLCVDNLGNIWATNANNGTISKYGKDGSTALTFSTKGILSDGPVTTKIGDIAYDSNKGGIVYVLAQVNGQNKILRYDSNGKYIRMFGEGLQDPQSITVSTDGKIYVTDRAKLKIHVFAPGK